MNYFFTLEKDLPAGVGFAHWGAAHIAWLVFSAALAAALCLAYRRASPAGRACLRRALGWAVLVCEAALNCNKFRRKGICSFYHHIIAGTFHRQR